MTITINGTTGITNDGGYTGDGVVFADTTPANTLVTTTGGNVGIGTSSPSTFTGYTTVSVNNATNGGIYNILVNGTETARLQGYSGIFNVAAKGASTALTFETNGTERARIDTSGNLLVGATSYPFGGQPKVSFISNSTTQGGCTAVQPNSTTSAGVSSQSVTTAGTGWYHFVGQSGNGSSITTNNIIIYGNGNVLNVNNSYGSLSDIKLKENVTDATPKLEKLQQVRVVNYNLIGDTQKQIGVIAQELEQVFPGMVEETSDRDAEGNDLGTTTKAVKYSVFVPMLIKAIQEQQAIIDAQQAALTALTARVAALDASLDARITSLEGTTNV